MDIKKFDFPETSDAERGFPARAVDPEMLKEAKAQGFLHGHTPYNKLFSDIFFSGKTVEFKKDLDPKFKEKAVPYMQSVMGSWESKHEHKEAVCALLLSELVEA